MVSDAFLPRLGGIEVQVHDLACRLQQAGHRVEIFTFTPEAPEGSVGTQNTDIAVLPGNYSSAEVKPGPVSGSGSHPDLVVHRFPFPLPADLLFNPRVRSHLEKNLPRFDLVHAHMGVLSPMVFSAVGVARRHNIPICVTVHSVASKRQKWLGPLLRRWAKYARISAVTQVAAAPIVHLLDTAGTRAPGSNDPHRLVAILPNGIDAELWENPALSTAENHSDSDVSSVRLPQSGPIALVSAMRLAARKRPLELIAALAPVAADFPRLRLEIYGEGPLRSQIDEAAREYPWLRAPGRLSREHLREKYFRAAAYISATEQEAFGIAALEARLAGLPVLAPQDSGVSAFITSGENGLLSADDEHLAANVRRVLEEPELYKKLRLSLGSATSFAWPQVVQMVEAEYAAASLCAS